MAVTGSPTDVITLFRGVKKNPRFLVTNLADELNELNRQYHDITKQVDEDKIKNPLEAFTRFGVDNFVRRFELQKIAGPQHFTDNEQIARDFAGEKGFVIQLKLPKLTADTHYQGEQMMKPRGTPQISSVFVFSGDELAHHLGDKSDWKIKVEIMEKQSHNKEHRAIRGLELKE